MHLLHLTTGNEITRSSGVSLCLAGKGCTGGSLPLPKQAPADPAWASGALCQVDKPCQVSKACQVDKPSVAWFCRALPAAHGLGARRTSVSVFLEQEPSCGSAQRDLSKSFIWTCMMLLLSHFALTCQFVPIPQVKSQFQSEALIWFNVLGLRLRTGNSTLPLNAFFHLPCKAQQSPSISHSVLEAHLGLSVQVHHHHISARSVVRGSELWFAPITRSQSLNEVTLLNSGKIWPTDPLPNVVRSGCRISISLVPGLLLIFLTQVIKVQEEQISVGPS